jgi:transposase
VRDIPAKTVPSLEQEIRAAKERFGLPPETPVASCYEAGRDGFWLHRCLLSMGVDSVVVDSSSIEIDRRQRRAKTDGMDVKKLLKMLVRYGQGEKDVWRIVRAPSVEEEDARQLHRELETLRHEQTSHTNRIKGLLSNYGLTLEVDRHRACGREAQPVRASRAPRSLDGSRTPIRYIRLQASPNSLWNTPPKGTNQLTSPRNAVNRKGQTTCRIGQRPREKNTS